jgi:hypothetical protein
LHHIHYRCHVLQKVTLTKTTPPASIDNTEGPTQQGSVSYVAGLDCTQRLLLYHALYHFPGRLQAFLLRRLQEQRDHNPGSSLLNLTLLILQDEDFPEKVTAMFQDLTRWVGSAMALVGCMARACMPTVMHLGV